MIGRNSAVGLLLGLAAGDRIGGPTHMALLVAESLAELERFDAADIGARYLHWWRNGAFDTGPTVAGVLRRVDAGMSFADAAAEVDHDSHGLTAGCNPTHRSAPLATLATLPDTQLAAAAIEEARLTHRHPLAGDVAAAVVTLCRTLIRGMNWSPALALAAEDRLPATQDALSRTPADSLSKNGFAPEVLRAAINFVGTSESPADALNRSIQFAGPAKYCPVLVGSIGGARWGDNSVPAQLLAQHLALLPRL